MTILAAKGKLKLYCGVVSDTKSVLSESLNGKCIDLMVMISLHLPWFFAYQKYDVTVGTECKSD